MKLKKLSTGPALGERACIRGSEYFFLESQIEGHKVHQLGSLANSAQSRPNRLSCLVGGFYGLYILSPCEGLIESF